MALTQTQKDFIAKVGALATLDMKASGVLASLTVAQAILESGWGTSALATQANALFGIKADSRWSGKTYAKQTKEFVDGKEITITANFRAYDSWEHSLSDHSAFLIAGARYAAVIGETDYKTACTAIHAAGYATDPGYAGKLINLIETYGLTDFDSVSGKETTMKIYLSPSNQPGNKYVIGNTTEKIEMEAVAAKVKTLLDRDYNCETVMATLSMGIGANERPQEAKNKSCDFYLAIHSNAAGSSPSTAAGAVGFFHPNAAKSKDLMTAMVNELNAVCPIKSNRASQVASGMTQFDGAGYGEIRSPMQKGVQSALIEVNFHDNPATAQYIIDNKDPIAGAIVKAIVSTLGIGKKNGSVTTPPTPAEPPKPVTPPTPIPSDPWGAFEIGTVVTIKPGTKNYYPGSPAIPGWVISDYNHRVTGVTSGGKPVVKGGKACVLLGKKTKKQGGSEEAGINTWVDIDVLTVVGGAESSSPSASAFQPYLVKVTIGELNIRKGPGTNFGTNGSIKDKGVYTIVEESAGQGATKWGKLKSGAGWIELEFTQRR